MKIFLNTFLFLFCVGCNSAVKNMEYETNLLDAGVSRITERFEIMIFTPGSHAESRELVIDGVIGYIERKTVYDENGRASRYYSGASEGLVGYAREDNKCGIRYLPFSKEHYNYECRIDKADNYIVETVEPRRGQTAFGNADLVVDTIHEFVIFPRKKIILSKEDNKLLQAAKFGKRNGERYVFYRYE